MRRVVVEANVRGRDLGGFVAEVRERLAPLEPALPPGYFVEYGGQFENQQRAMRQLAIVVPIALAADPAPALLALGSARDALLVLAQPALRPGRGAWSPRSPSGCTLSVSAAVAFIVLLGIAVQNGVVLVAFFEPAPRARPRRPARRSWRAAACASGRC